MLFSKRAVNKDAPESRRGAGAGVRPMRHMSHDGDAWRAPEKPPTDWKKVLLLAGLGSLSWISTFTGMLELIQANMGEVAFIFKMAIGFAVAMLMLMIIWLLDQLFSRLNFTVRTLFICGYLFLTLISIGFGFGFYWKFLESRSEASRSAESAVTQVQSALLSAQTRLEQLQTTLEALTAISAQKAVDEREKGNSCPNSRPGDGPRRRLRDADASRFGFASQFVKTRVGTVKSDIGALNVDLQKVVTRDKSTIDPRTGTRNIFLRGLGRKLDMAVTRFNAFRTDPQLRQYRSEFADRSAKTVFDNGKGGTFVCPDPQLQSALRGVVRAIDQLPELENPKVAAVEGSEAIIEAFRRLTTTLFGVIKLKMPPTPDELRSLQERAVQSVQNAAHQRRILAQQPGLGERDYIPLFIALFVDFCLLLVSVSRPMNGFDWLDHKMGQAQEWPIIKILSRFRDIHSDEEIREVFDVFRHVVFDWRGIYYAAIPINGTDPTLQGGLNDDAAIQARLLANLFTSFENDKVYKRVPVPMFTTGFIRRKLSDQGSKYAEAEAFRIYRFQKDAWQDWMLGAMMGAAKRVETRKRALQLEEQLFGRSEPPLHANDETPLEVKSSAEADQPVEDNGEPQFELDDVIAGAVDDTISSQRDDKHHRAERIAAAMRQRDIEIQRATNLENAATPFAGPQLSPQVAPPMQAPPAGRVPNGVPNNFRAPGLHVVPKTVTLAARVGHAWMAHSGDATQTQHNNSGSHSRPAGLAGNPLPQTSEPIPRHRPGPAEPTYQPQRRPEAPVSRPKNSARESDKAIPLPQLMAPPVQSWDRPLPAMHNDGVMHPAAQHHPVGRDLPPHMAPVRTGTKIDTYDVGPMPSVLDDTASLDDDETDTYWDQPDIAIGNIAAWYSKGGRNGKKK